MTAYEPLQPPERSRSYWPKVGDEDTAIEGLYETTETGKYTEVIVLRTRDGVRKVNASARVQAVLPQMKLGARYRFTYRGTIPLASGQTVKDIRVERVRDDTDPPDDPPNEPGDPADEVPF